MRQLKAFMKAKKGVCSKKCECLTINMWRCADLQNDYEFCGCDGSEGGGKTNVPNGVYNEYVELTSSIINAKIFVNSSSDEDYIEIAFDTQLGYVLTPHGSFDSDGGNAIITATQMAEQQTTGTEPEVMYVLGKGGVFPQTGLFGTYDSSFMSMVNKVYNTPSEENIEMFASYLIERANQYDLAITYEQSKSSIVMPETKPSISIQTGESQITSIVVTPDTESITVTSDDDTKVSLKLEKVTEVPINAYNLKGTGIEEGTVTITVTCVNDPTVSKSFSLEIVA